MPWVDGYTSSDEKSLVDIEWPHAKRCCSTVVVDYSVPSLTGEITEHVIEEAEAIYGDSVNGLWLLELLSQYNVKATFSVIPSMVERFPKFIRQVIEAGHEIAVGGDNKKDISHLSYNEEKESILKTTEFIQSVAGIKSAGWFSLPRTGDQYPGGFLTPNTFNLLKEAGYKYFGNGMADDIPYYTNIDINAKSCMLTMPYYYHFDSQFFLFFPGVGSGTGLMNFRKLEKNWNDELDGALHFGRSFTLVIQPCLAYWGGTYEVLSSMLQRLSTEKHIWQATYEQCADWWLKRYPSEKYLHLKI